MSVFGKIVSINVEEVLNMIYTNYKKIDEVGRIVISKNIRKHLSIEANDMLKIDVDGNAVVIKKAEPYCEFCGSEDSLVEFHGKSICRKCLDALNKL